MKTTKQAEQTIREMATLSKRTDAREAVRDLRYGDHVDAVEAIEAVGESRAVAMRALVGAAGESGRRAALRDPAKDLAPNEGETLGEYRQRAALGNAENAPPFVWRDGQWWVDVPMGLDPVTKSSKRRAAGSRR